MISKQTRFVLLLAALVAMVGVLRAETGPFQDDDSARVLVLRNGYVLHGKISRDGDMYVVTQKDGEIRLPATRIDQVGRSLQEVYQHKRRSLTPGSVPEVLDLVRWCMRQQMLAESKDLIAHSLTLDATDPRISPLARQVRQALELEKSPSARPAPRPTTIVAQATPPAELPQGALELFTHRIQPLLLNRCGTTVCHGPAGKSGFRLHRPARGSLVHSRLTQSNLAAALRFVKRDDPQASPLLVLPSRSHGTARRAIFAESQANQYATLSAWVHGISTPSRPVKPANITQEPAHLSQTSSAPKPVTPAVKPKKLPLLETKPAQYGASVKRYQPRDEFDPEIFNRRFFKDEPAKDN